MGLAINSTPMPEATSQVKVIPFGHKNQAKVMDNRPSGVSETLLLELKNITKSYGEDKAKITVLDNINLKIKNGEFIAIVGFSGSGKTTLISTIAGLIQPDAGEVLKQDIKISAPGPDRGVVFQNYSLMPWLTVFENVALAVDHVYKDWPKAQRKAHAEHYIKLVNLSAAHDKKPAELSGGMRQRVNVARALAANPDILLLDEPLSALDALTRGKLQDEILQIWEQEKKTVILITNDVDEAIYMADRIIPLNPGPNATLGPDFFVDIDRPRNRSDLNHNDVFKQCRASITHYLMSISPKNMVVESNNKSLPSVKPNTSFEWQLTGNQTQGVQKTNERPRLRYLEFSQLTKSYPTPDGNNFVNVVENFDLKVKKGEFISIIGHSGCGKSTVLSMAAGLNSITSGAIFLDNREVVTAGPDRGIVFQAPSLFPWLTAYENVMLGVDKVYPHATAGERKDIAEYNLMRVGLVNDMHKKADDLSNGMKQRVGIARAFALSPKLLLLDEPFGMLDSLTRWELQEVLMEIWERTHVTALIVTHDVDEAILLADRVVMMTNGPRANIGKIETIDLPRPRSRKDLLSHPDYYKYRESILRFLSDCEHTH
jgi:nitrate/nitrite transport system ATP-binding protein